jgi:hypothetical protein
MDNENAKLHFRKGRALSQKGDYEEAAEALKLCARAWGLPVACSKGVQRSPLWPHLGPELKCLHSTRCRVLTSVCLHRRALEHEPSLERDVKAELALNAQRKKAAVEKQKADMGGYLRKT